MSLLPRQILHRVQYAIRVKQRFHLPHDTKFDITLDGSQMFIFRLTEPVLGGNAPFPFQDRSKHSTLNELCQFEIFVETVGFYDVDMGIPIPQMTPVGYISMAGDSSAYDKLCSLTIRKQSLLLSRSRRASILPRVPCQRSRERE